MMMASRSLRSVSTLGLAAHDDGAAAEVIGGADAGAAEDQRPGRKIRAGYDLDEVVDAERGIVDQREAGVDDLTEIVRRDVGRHADRDAACTIGEEVREPRRQHHRLALGIVVVRREIDGVLVDVREQRVRDLGEAHLGVAHRRGRIAVDRAEIALAVDQRQAHGEILRHAHQRVIDRLVAMGMILADDVADHAGGLAIRLVPLVAGLVHRIEDAAVHRLEAVARIGQRARHDHAHGVVEIGPLHLLDDGDGAHIGGARTGFPGCLIVIGQK